MRNLKFRAWDDLNKKWLMGYDVGNLGGFSLTGECMLFGEWAHCFDEFLFERDGKKNEHLIVEQFTGLVDKNGKDVYEGDIIKFKTTRIHTKKDNIGREWASPRAKWFKSAVLWSEGTFLVNEATKITLDPEDYDTYLCAFFGAKSKVGDFVAEVIGNIHDNPNLS